MRRIFDRTRFLSTWKEGNGRSLRQEGEGLFSCKRRERECRCKKVCRAGGRGSRDFLFVVSIFFVKEQERFSVENEVVNEHFRKMKKAFKLHVCCSDVGFGYREQNDSRQS